MSKLVITRMELKNVPVYAAAVEDNGKILELRMEPVKKDSILGNIYVGQVKELAENIQAAFVQIGDGQICYYPLSEQKDALFSNGFHRGESQKLRPGDQFLVQVSREAIKQKLPSVTSNLNFTGKYLVLTTANKKLGLSGKLSKEERAKWRHWLEAETGREYGIIVRTNAKEARKEEVFRELEYLKKRYHKAAVLGRSRTCFSLLEKAEPFYLSMIRDFYQESLTEIVTDQPGLLEEIRTYLMEYEPENTEKLRFYEDKLLPLYKLYSLQSAFEEALKERIWLKSGGFLVIQQTEAFVSIDVNSGKYTGKKKVQETYRKINLEAAAEIARQLRLRNLSGIILIDFINLEKEDHRQELFHVLQKHLEKDPVKASAVDMTALQITEVTRKKIRRSLAEDFKALEEENCD